MRSMATDVATGRAVPKTAAGDFDGDLLIERSRELATSHLRGRDGLASLAIAGAFAVAATTLAVLAHSARPLHPATLAIFLLSYALASRIDFEVGTGSAV